MQTKRFVAVDMRRALTLVRDELGDDAMILSTQRTSKGVEIVATADDIPPATSPAQQQPIPAPREVVTEATQVGPASGKTREELALEMEMARRRMLAMQQQENMTLGQMAQQPARPASTPRPQPQQVPAQSQSSPRFSEIEPSQLNQWLNEAPAKDETYSSMSAYRTESPQQGHQPSQPAAQSAQYAPQQPAVSREESENIRKLQEEIASMRHFFSDQLTAMADAQARQFEVQQRQQELLPAAAGIRQKLETLGLTRACTDQVVASLKSINDEGMNQQSLWVESLGRLARKIPALTNDPVATGGIYAFLGTTGVGKTTTIAKLAARHVMEHGADQVALLTTDTFRIAAHDQLRSLGRILNVQVRVVDDLNQLPEILSQFSRQSLVLIDTLGMGYNDPLLKQHLTALKRCRHLQTALVLSANSQFQMMQASLHSYRIANPRFCVMTKLDECASLGDAISLLAANDLPMAYITNGQAVPDDLAIMKPHQFVTKAVALSKQADGEAISPGQQI